MSDHKAFRDCISSSEDELIIYAADNFSQFPRRTASVTSKCDRALPVANLNDLVVLRGTLDHEYHNWLRSVGLGSDHVVEYGEGSIGMTLSKLIIDNPEPIEKIIFETGRKPVYVPWYSGKLEAEAAKVLKAALFGALESESLKYNDKASFKIICQQLDIPVIEGVSFEIQPQKSGNCSQMKSIVDEYLKRYDFVIIRGTLGESGMSLYKTNGNDTAELYREISDSDEKVIIIEPFLNASSSPNDQWIIGRDGTIHHLGMRAQLCKQGMIHIGTVNKFDISTADAEHIKTASLKFVKKMKETGYKGVVGIDYIVSNEGVFPVENNARFNGSSYSIMIADRIEKLIAPVPIWKFMKIETSPCSFIELKKLLVPNLFNGVEINSIFPYSCESLTDTGNFSVMFLAENMEQIVQLEQSVNQLTVS